jgi:hypothetical protein
VRPACAVCRRCFKYHPALAETVHGGEPRLYDVKLLVVRAMESEYVAIHWLMLVLVGRLPYDVDSSGIVRDT